MTIYSTDDAFSVKVKRFNKMFTSILTLLFLLGICRLILKLLDVKVGPIYRTFKDGNGFKLKSHIPSPLGCNVVYRFTRTCDTAKTYIGMSCRYLVINVREHLNLNNN